MTGPEHYREAERLVTNGQRCIEEATPSTIDAAEDVARSAFAAAQVHATLALVAASITTSTVEVSHEWVMAVLA